MEKFIPYKKLSKKEKRKLDQAKRKTWGELNPVTRKPANRKAYNRKKSQTLNGMFKTVTFLNLCHAKEQFPVMQKNPILLKIAFLLCWLFSFLGSICLA